MEYLTRRFKKSSKIVDRLIDDEVVIVPISSQDFIYNLDATGAIIWRLINGKNSLKQIRDYLVRTTDVSLQQAEKDLKEFIQDLEEAGAIEEAK